jgi:hypothetical protein
VRVWFPSAPDSSISAFDRSLFAIGVAIAPAVVVGSVPGSVVLSEALAYTVTLSESQ